VAGAKASVALWGALVSLAGQDTTVSNSVVALSVGFSPAEMRCEKLNVSGYEASISPKRQKDRPSAIDIDRLCQDL
jgi:hypothetical protein